MDALMLMGEASRLKDKPFLDADGKPLFKHGWDVLEEVFDAVLIACVPSVEEKLKAFDVPYVLDYERAGPLSGIRAGFRALYSDYVFVTACDMPLLNEGVIRLMKKHVKMDGLVPRHLNGFIEPLHAFYLRSKVLNALSSEFTLKSPRQLIGKMSVVYFDTALLLEEDPELKSFVNVNTREELDSIN